MLAGDESGPGAVPLVRTGTYPPNPGRYVFSQTETVDGDTEQSQTSWIVTSERDSDGTVITLRSASGSTGEPSDQSSEVIERWTASAVVRTFLTFPSRPRGGRTTCELQPEMLRLPLPIEVGLEWEAEAWCGSKDNREKHEIEGRVIGQESVQVAGQQFPAFVMDLKTSMGLPGYAWFVDDTTAWFAPDLGLIVRSEGLRREVVGGAYETQRRAQLISWPRQ